MKLAAIGPRSKSNRWIARSAVLAAAGSVALGAAVARNQLAERRVATVIDGRAFRGAWQKPRPLRSIIQRERIRTLLTLTAINRNDPKYVDQERVVRGEGVGWVVIPMRGSTATLEQLAWAADAAADPELQPVFFHCVGGHHRSNLVQAAIRIRRQGWSAAAAWNELASLSWTRPDAESDRNDRALIERFARVQSSIPRASPDRVREFTHAIARQPRHQMVDSRLPGRRPAAVALDRLD